MQDAFMTSAEHEMRKIQEMSNTEEVSTQRFHLLVRQFTQEVESYTEGLYSDYRHCHSTVFLEMARLFKFPLHRVFSHCSNLGLSILELGDSFYRLPPDLFLLQATKLPQSTIDLFYVASHYPDILNKYKQQFSHKLDTSYSQQVTDDFTSEMGDLLTNQLSHNQEIYPDWIHDSGINFDI
jgi:hypothetical protein